MANIDGIKLEAAERAVCVKALLLLAQSRERQLSKEVPGSPIWELLSQEIGSIESLAGRFR